MALTNISAYRYNLLELSLSANENEMSWVPFYYAGESGGLVPIIDTTRASAVYVRTGDPVVWGATHAPNTDIIAITATKDNQVIYFSGGDTVGNTITSQYLDPYRLKVSHIVQTPLSASLSCYYIQAGTNSITGIPDATIISWFFTPSIPGVSAAFGFDEGVFDSNVINPISGATLSASRINLTSPVISSYDQELFIIPTISSGKYATSVNPIISFTSTNEMVVLNPSINIKVDEQSTDYIILCALQYGEKLIPNGISLVWDATGNNLTAYETDLVTPYILGSVEDSTNVNKIQLSATDYTNTYPVMLSSYTGLKFVNFRPYQNTTTLTTLTAQVIKLGNEENVYIYLLKCLGSTAGVFHNLEENQYIAWNTSDTNIEAVYTDGITPYSYGNVGVAPNIDTLYLRITPQVVSSNPQTHTASLQVCALSTSLIKDGVITKYDFNIIYSDWFDDNYYNPAFRFQYEPENQDIIYRPLSSTSVVYQISNISIIPENTWGYIDYKFNDGVQRVDFDLTANTTPPTGIMHNFNTATECVCTVSISISAYSANWSGFVARDSRVKQIIFTEIPIASSFKILPEWCWDGSNWIQAVYSKQTNSGRIDVPTAVLSAYSFCHTENFFVSSNIPNKLLYKWSAQSIENPTRMYQTEFTSPTGWWAIKTNEDTENLAISASIFTNTLSSNMPLRYYDTPAGTKFTNFTNTYESITGSQRRHILLSGKQSIGLVPCICGLKFEQHPTPNNILLTGAYIADTTLNTPICVDVSVFYFNLSSVYWNEIVSATSNSTDIVKNIYINLDDIGDSYLGVPKNDTTQIKIIPGVGFNATVYPHPSALDWCDLSDSLFISANNQIITAYPITPLIYTPNRFVVTGVPVSYQNLVQCYSGIIQFNWVDRNTTKNNTTCEPYITAYSDQGTYGLNLTTVYNYITVDTSYNEFTDLVNIQNMYNIYDSNLTRVFDNTRLRLPYDKQSCSMPPNEWVIKDTFNSNIIKLHNNLLYLDNMSQLYDTPPTDYIGWYGALTYNNGVLKTRWYVNIPHISYAYDQPERAVDYNFNDLQDCFIRNNIMYISNGNYISIHSADINGTQIGYRPYKTIGDDFTCIRAISLDSENRIYALDSYNDKNNNGSKNRILVYDFNVISAEWTLLYEWGGLGGAGAKYKFNNPSDLHIDAEDFIWVSDTSNKCIKKYTRTGSWLYTLQSDYFSDTEKPLSVTTDTNYIYILTNSMLLKYTHTFDLVSKFDIPIGGLKVRLCSDGGFVYVVYSDKVLKIMITGDVAGIIGDSGFTDYNKDYRSVFHDEFRNLYIINNNHILKYVDLLYVVNLKPLIDNSYWSLNQLLVQKDEYIQDWVINRCLQRLWDNLEIFRRDLRGKFGYKSIQNITTTNVPTSLQPPEDFDYCNRDWLYSYTRIVSQNVITEYDKPVVRTFKTDEYKFLPYTKSEIYVGINELNSAEVYNRVLGKLYDCQETLLEMIAD